MYIPTIKKIKYSNNVLVERSLPSKGSVSAKIGQKVEPFARLGISKVSYDDLLLPAKLKISKGLVNGNFVYGGKKIGSIGLKPVLAPFNGYLSLNKDGAGYSLKEEERDFWLLSGVWGEVVNVTKDKSVLIKAQTIDVHLAACTKTDMEGELVVFPNPSDVLEMQYLENFAKDVYGKIIYVGDFASERFIKKAIDHSVGGIIAGGADREGFDIAKRNGIFLGIFTGFGYEIIPDLIFNILKDVSNRYVFVIGGKNLLRIPAPEPFLSKDAAESLVQESIFKYVKKGLRVLVLQKPYFGWMGEIDRVSGSSIFVRFDGKKDSVEVLVPNILAVD